jgi:hypothetical protein
MCALRYMRSFQYITKLTQVQIFFIIIYLLKRVLLLIQIKITQALQTYDCFFSLKKV